MFESSMAVGSVLVKTTNNRGFMPEELAEDMLAKLIYIADSAPAPIRDQAIAFRERMRPLIVHYLAQAARSDRTTVLAYLDAVDPEAAELVRKI